jgi:hypothetical protein
MIIVSLVIIIIKIVSWRIIKIIIVSRIIIVIIIDSRIIKNSIRIKSIRTCAIIIGGSENQRGKGIAKDIKGIRIIKNLIGKWNITIVIRSWKT